jgi:hypothetical protein
MLRDQAHTSAALVWPDARSWRVGWMSAWEWGIKISLWVL